MRCCAGSHGRRRTSSSEASNVPAWFEESLIAAYGKEKTSAILAIQSKEPPIDLTVKGDRRNGP